MGITQSDEYCEIYERFIEEYDTGKPLLNIKMDILDEYLTEFDEKDGVLHDIYFAIGKAEWMCGGISPDIFEKISQIIKSGENITFYKELEATEHDLKLRQKNLDKFLNSLSTPRGKTKKRRTPTEKYIELAKPKLPPFLPGDIFAYEIGGRYRLLCFISRKRLYSTYAAYCYVWEKFYDHIPLIEDLFHENILPIGYFTAETFPDTDKLKLIGNNSDMKRLDLTYPWGLNGNWRPATQAIAKEEYLTELFPTELYMNLSECIQIIEKLLETKF